MHSVNVAPFGDALYSHYDQLRRWNPRVSLVGPGTAERVVERHYGESLAGLAFLDGTESTLVDIGSGGGFPGFVLAAARPRQSSVLVEPKTRKWAFLKAAIRAAGLSCRCLNARVDRPLPAELPEKIDVVTLRALALPAAAFEALRDHSPQVRFLLWHGEGLPALPPGFHVSREMRLPMSERRRVVEVRTG